MGQLLSGPRCSLGLQTSPLRSKPRPCNTQAYPLPCPTFPFPRLVPFACFFNSSSSSPVIHVTPLYPRPLRSSPQEPPLVRRPTPDPCFLLVSPPFARPRPLEFQPGRTPASLLSIGSPSHLGASPSHGPSSACLTPTLALRPESAGSDWRRSPRGERRRHSEGCSAAPSTCSFCDDRSRGVGPQRAEADQIQTEVGSASRG